MIDPKRCLELINTNSLRTTQAPYKLSFTLPESLPYFDGHFPGTPILPAIAVIDLSVEFVKNILSQDNLEIKEVCSAKFYSIIKPNDQIDVELESKENITWKIRWLIDNKKVVDLIVSF